MRAAYVDSSCLVAIALGEPGYKSIAADLESRDRLLASPLLEAELRSALAREKVTADASQLLTWISWVTPHETLSEQLARVFRQGYVRGADAWHLACALFVSPRPEELDFLTLDSRQKQVAAALGFPCGIGAP